LTRSPDSQYLYDLGLLLLQQIEGTAWPAEGNLPLQRVRSYLAGKHNSKGEPRTPPLRMECRPPKQGEMIWNGVQGKVELMPWDSKYDHWVLVPVPLNEREVQLCTN